MLFRCPSCRTRRRDYGLFSRHIKSTGHALCKCGGYHYAHRPGSPFCEANAMSDVLLASRQGTPDHELGDIAAKRRAAAFPNGFYRGPNGETWSGRGLVPRWLAIQIAHGYDKQSFLVKP